MARKRKTRATEAPQEPEPVQETEPAPELELELDPEQPQPVETLQEEAAGDGEEVVEEEVEVEVEEEEMGDGDGEGEPLENMEEDKQPDTVATDLEEDKQPDAIVTELEENKQPDAVATDLEEDKQPDTVATDPKKNGQGVEITDKPSVTENGQGQDNEEGEEELEEEPLEKLLEPFSRDQLTLLIKEAVAKHPDVMESVHRLADADPSHCKIFVHGLGWEASTETITIEFSKYGEIQDCKVVKDKISGKSKGYGFILFKNRNGARRALKQPQKTIQGRLASCQLASAGPVQAPPPAAVATVSTTPANEYTQRKIFVSNVAAELEPRKLLEFFSEFGEIEEGPLGLDKQTGKPRGFCLFVYKSLESAKKALEEPHKNYEGHTLHCQKAVDGPKHTKGFFNQQHGQPHHGLQKHYNHPAKKGKYAGSSGVGRTGGHLMAPSGGASSAGFNQAVAPEAIGQAVAALLATQGAGLGFGNLLGGIGGGVNPQGVPPMMNNGGYGGQGGGGGYGGQPGGGSYGGQVGGVYGGQVGGGGYGGQVGGGGYGGQPGMQGGYGGQQQQQMGQGGVRPNQGGAPYMGHGI